MGNCYGGCGSPRCTFEAPDTTWRRSKMRSNTTSEARGNLSRTQETVQTIPLTNSVTGTWLALYRVPWQLSGDPCLVASAATAVVVTCLWLTRWRGLRAANFWLWVEVLGTLIFVALAVLGVKRSPWFLAS